jgi:hypothetical protein
LVYKPEGIKGYDVTAKEWWGGDQNIPYGWIRPSDYISDYFIRVVAVKGNWTNYPVLSNDPIWHKYFDKNGIIKEKIGTFCSAEGITFIGSWTGLIIPNFVDKQGNYLYIEDKVNAVTERTGLLMSINEDAFQVLSYDKNGVDVETGEETGVGTWIYDFDANNQADSELGEGAVENSGYLVDMVGHNLQNGIYSSEYYLCLGKTNDNHGGSSSYPTAYFLKTLGSLDESADAEKVYPLQFNGRDTEDTKDDIKETAKIRVLIGEDSSFYKAFVVIDTSTNKPIKGNGDYPGVKYWYVSSENITSDDIESIDTGSIKTMQAYGQKNKDVAYNLSDKIEEKTINDIITGTSAENHELSLKAIPVVKDTNDNFIYEDKFVYYGTYAYLKPMDEETLDPSCVEIFAVTGGLKVNSYATIQDIGKITEDKTGVSLEKAEGVITKTTHTSDNKSLNGYTFTFDGQDYFVEEEFKTIYKAAQSVTPTYFGVNFLSYNYITENVGDAITEVYHAYYFNGMVNTKNEDEEVELKDSSLYNVINSDDLKDQEIPVTETNLNTFIVTNELEAAEISVGDYINNIAFYNNIGEAEKYNVIPGITKVISKLFVNVDARSEFYYKGKKYHINIEALKNGQLIETKSGKRGFYLFTTLEPVYISKHQSVTRQLPITHDIISHSLKFIPMKGLHISAKHRPGFDEYGKVDVEGGI